MGAFPFSQALLSNSREHCPWRRFLPCILLLFWETDSKTSTEGSRTCLGCVLSGSWPQLIKGRVLSLCPLTRFLPTPTPSPIISFCGFLDSLPRLGSSRPAVLVFPSRPVVLSDHSFNASPVASPRTSHCPQNRLSIFSRGHPIRLPIMYPPNPRTCSLLVLVTASSVLSLPRFSPSTPQLFQAAQPRALENGHPEEDITVVSVAQSDHDWYILLPTPLAVRHHTLTMHQSPSPELRRKQQSPGQLNRR